MHKDTTITIERRSALPVYMVQQNYLGNGTVTVSDFGNLYNLKDRALHG
jgi:hypothetical protein